MSAVKTAPRLKETDAIRLVREFYRIAAHAESLPSERDQNFLLRDASGARFVLKIANAQESREVLDLQNRMIQFLDRRAPNLQWPRLVPSLSGEEIVSGDYLFRLLTWVEGECLARANPHDRDLLRSLGRGLARMDAALQDFSHPAASRTLYWDLRHFEIAIRQMALLPNGPRELVEPYFEAARHIDWSALRSSVIHGDANDYNVLVHQGAVTSFLDFGDAVNSATVCDLAIALAYAMLDKEGPVAAAVQVIEAYHEVRPLDHAEIDALYTLVMTRLAMSVCYAASQSRESPDNEYLNITNASAWKLLERMASVPADLPRDMFRRACSAGRRTVSGLEASRRSHIGPSLSLSYRRPLHIVRGWKQHLYDSEGAAYLDCINNVAHVGHSHPRVVQAVAQQMAALNTNTRYLHENLADYAERLIATLPAPLSVVYLVCSGSEANELALRLARAHTRREEVIVVDTAYHGNTSTLVEISPYKFNGAGGRGKPGYVHVVPMPDVYRGRHRDADAGSKYAAYVAGAVDATRGAAAFFCESALGCGGQIILPSNYLRESFEAVRSVGGVCIADEVQVGFGRVGSHFWGFETQGIIPDIVTMGKPIGNGHPMGAVVTTPEIAASFYNGMEYFNTFGGNPVSCAAGLAVLDVLRDEELQSNALQTGAHLKSALNSLKKERPMIGDVRGLGLFIGIELVRNSETLEPADREASEIVEQMKDRGVLLSTDGPLHNVIKIKPPLVFSEADADHLVHCLAEVMGAR